MLTLQKVGVLSLGKISGILMAIFGLFIAIILLSLSIFAYNGGAIPVLGATPNYTGLIITPLSYGIIGFIFGTITALLYNLFTPWIGGIKVDLRQKKTTETNQGEH